jgi:CO dehydrogenase maturation factor
MEAQTRPNVDPLPLRGQRILVCGKGGSGKSSLVALLAKALAARGYAVVALDGDASNPGGLARLLLDEPTPTRPLIEFFGGREHVECPIDDPSPLTRVGDATPVLERPIAIEEVPAEYRVDQKGITLMRVGKITRALEGCEGPMSKVTALEEAGFEGRPVPLGPVAAEVEAIVRALERMPGRS